MHPRSLSLHALAPASLAALSLATGTAAAAPEAHVLRIVDDGASITTLVDLVQSRQVAAVTVHCAALTGDANLDCAGAALEKPGALFNAFAFPEKNAVFTVAVNGSDTATTFDSSARWGDSAGQPGIGTAWLILVDAAGNMGTRFTEAKAIAGAFVDAMGPSDIAEVMMFGDRGLVLDSRWVAQKAQAAAALAGVSRPFPLRGGLRPLFDILKVSATDGFKDLGSVGPGVAVPMHQALVVISSGWFGADPHTTATSAAILRAYLTYGRFPKSTVTLPKMPAPAISIWLPIQAPDDQQTISRAFMEGLANPEIGGFYTVLRDGQAAARAPGIVAAVRGRFAKMHVVKWRATCAAGATQTYKLSFASTTPPILGDATFQDVPVGQRPPCSARP